MVYKFIIVIAKVLTDVNLLIKKNQGPKTFNIMYDQPLLFIMQTCCILHVCKI